MYLCIGCSGVVVLVVKEVVLMGTDMHFLSESMEKQKGSLAIETLNEVIRILEDDRPFKQKRIDDVVLDYRAKRKRF